jgi:hypothetical protein
LLSPAITFMVKILNFKYVLSENLVPKQAQFINGLRPNLA